jgi:hypothetical protein
MVVDEQIALEFEAKMESATTEPEKRQIATEYINKLYVSV